MTHMVKKEPSVEKAAVLDVVEGLVGRTRQVAPRRPDWRVSHSGRTSVFITFSNFSEDGDLFYDVSQADLEAWLEYERAFVVFVMGEARNVLVVPVAALRDRVLVWMKPKERGNFKLHVTGTSHLRFSAVPAFALDDWHNAFELLRE